MKKTALAILSSALLFTAPAGAVEEAAIQAHPQVWHVHTGHSEITLFGSLHMLPANMGWLTPDIWHSIKTSEVFVFEVPTDDISRNTLTSLLDARGTLPQGQSLRAMLTPAAQADFDTAIKTEHLSASVTDREQPWLANLQLVLADTMNRSYYPDAGVDYVAMNWAVTHRRDVRYLETVKDQAEMLAPSPSEIGGQLGKFESALKQVGQEEDIDPVVQAWSDGNMDKLMKMIDVDFQGHPDSRKRLLTDRNIEWAGKIEKMAGEWRNFFVVVGAAHLGGPDGLPALLRKDGFQVDGP